MKKVIFTEKAPAAIGPYSQAIEANGMVFLSGQLPVDPATGEFVPGGVAEQTAQAFENIKHVLAAAGLTTANIVKTTVFLADMSLFAEMNAVYAKYFEGDFPARSAIAVKALPKGALVEIVLAESRNKKSNVGTISYMPPIFGCFIASVVVRDLLGE